MNKADFGYYTEDKVHLQDVTSSKIWVFERPYDPTCHHEPSNANPNAVAIW